MLEKLAPTFLAGMPAIVKPATITSYLTQAMVREMIDSGILPEGALQLIVGSTGDLLDHLGGQDVVTFTGSASTGRKLKTTPSIVENAVRFNMEADSLNFSMLGPESTPGTDEFDLFVKEVVREMTVKAGQKCTAIRRTLVPQAIVDDAVKAIEKRLAGVKIGDPQAEGIRMGPLVGKSQVKEVRERVEELKRGSELVFGNPDDFDVAAGDKAKGAFFPTTLLYCNSPLDTLEPHNIEAFGPVNTIMPYKHVDDAIDSRSEMDCSTILAALAVRLH
jgi:oxepin-CoA hydrolase/3-oxo-5,6-dehydrosuberyl-CoA semialdehyde dehydrogenase